MRRNVVGVLTAQRRIACRAVAVTCGAVAARTGWYLSLSDAGKVDLATQRHLVGICHTTSTRLGVIKGCDVGEVLVRHIVDLPRHQRDRTTTITDILHLLQQILVAEPRQLGKRRHSTVTVYTVARHTGRRLGLPCFGVTGSIGARSHGHGEGQKRDF